MKRAFKPPGDAGRAESGAAEWNGTMVRGLAALEFLERSSDMAAERVVAAPAATLAIDEARLETSPSTGENFPDSRSGPVVR
jgi:hypothetical protein